MIVEKHDGSQERHILTGMVVSSQVLSRIASRWDKDGLFASPWANLIGGWCIRHYRKYHKAPGRQIEAIFASWAEDCRDKDNIKLVEQFLGNLSGDYVRRKKAINVNFLTDEAGDYFNRVKLKRFAEAIENDLATGRVSAALARLPKFHKVELGKRETIDILSPDAYDSVFQERSESLIRFKGDLGKFFGRSLSRDNFVAFMGPMKRAKSYWLLHVGYEAMLQRRRVLMLQLGDLSRTQAMARFAVRVANKPLYPDKFTYPKAIDVEGESASIRGEPKKFSKGLSKQELREACKRVIDKYMQTEESYLKMEVYPTRSFTVDSLRAVIDELTWHNWVPDVVVADYADIMAAPAGFRGESRDAVNENWMGLRRVSQEVNGLVLTATQANAASFRADSLGMEHFSEDNRKFAHVTSMVGLNQSQTEKAMGVWRLNWLVRREEEYTTKDYCYTAGALALANPAILAKLPNKS